MARVEALEWMHLDTARCHSEGAIRCHYGTGGLPIARLPLALITQQEVGNKSAYSPCSKTFFMSL